MINTSTVFRRYANAPEKDNGVRMPADVLDARVSSLCLSEVLGRFERFSTGESDGPEMFP